MSAASHASSQVRSPSPQARHAAAAAARVPARPAPVHAFASSEAEEEFKLHLSDLPRVEESLDVEGLKPSLLSRLFELVAPINKR